MTNALPIKETEGGQFVVEKQKSGVRVHVGRMTLTEGADLIDAYLDANPRYRRGAVIAAIRDRVNAQVEHELGAAAAQITRKAIADALVSAWED